jgi:hypothetical protein
MALDPELEERLRGAIRHFWTSRDSQAEKQGTKTGSRDAGARTAVTGGGANEWICIPRSRLPVRKRPPQGSPVFAKRGLNCPAGIDPDKKWDLLIVAEGSCLRAILAFVFQCKLDSA